MLLGAALGGPVAAQEAGAKPDQSEELKRLEAEIEASRARVEALNEEAETLARESRGLRRQLVDAAAQVQSQEHRLSDVEARLFALLGRESAVVDSLTARRGTMTDLVAALESLAINRPPALGVKPDDATQAARSAMLLSAIIPELRQQALTLERELNDLAKLRESIRTEQHEALAAAHALETERNALESKLAALTDRRASTMASAQEEQSRLAALARNAKDMRGFLDALAIRGLTAMPRLKPEDTHEREPDKTQVALARPGHFARLKGVLRPPVAGEVTRTFGAATDEGGASRGILFATRANAQVVSPCDGTVVFSGPFRGYGLLLIIQADDGYHFVLSGMTRVDAVARQRLLAGEPVGIMGDSGSLAAAGQAPQLYVELRRRGEPVDPLPWLAVNGKASG